MECFILHYHIYPAFVGKMSTLMHFLHEPDCEECSFLHQAVADFEHGLHSILTTCWHIRTRCPLWWGWCHSAFVFSDFLCLVNTVSDTSWLQLASRVKSHKLWCQTRTQLLPVLLASKISASKLIHYISSHPATFGLRASLLPDNTALNPANQRI